MSLLLDLLSFAALALGSFLCLNGAIGLLRLPDLLSRIHAASLIDTLGAPLILLGLMAQTGWSLDTLKLLLVVAFILLTNPTAAHALCRAALHDGIPTPADENSRGASSKS